MKAWKTFIGKLSNLEERLNALSLRERGLIFAAGVTLIFIAWQTLLMTPLTERARAAEQRLAEARQRLMAIEQTGEAAIADPAIAAAGRNRALQARLSSLDAELAKAAQGYVPPQRVSELLRQILVEQKGVSLVSLTNLPVQSLSQPPSKASAEQSQVGSAAAQAAAVAVPSIPANDRGPFLHPIEIVVDGDYVSVVAYLRAMEKLPYRIHWQELELSSTDTPRSRVRLVIGALSLSRDWIKV